MNPVTSLWKQVFGYEAEHNATRRVIDQKRTFGDGLFSVALRGTAVVGTIMAGYETGTGGGFALSQWRPIAAGRASGPH